MQDEDMTDYWNIRVFWMIKFDPDTRFILQQDGHSKLGKYY